MHMHIAFTATRTLRTPSTGVQVPQAATALNVRSVTQHTILHMCRARTAAACRAGSLSSGPMVPIARCHARMQLHLMMCHIYRIAFSSQLPLPPQQGQHVVFPRWQQTHRPSKQVLKATAAPMNCQTKHHQVMRYQAKQVSADAWCWPQFAQHWVSQAKYRIELRKDKKEPK